jgi:hypothetical protein
MIMTKIARMATIAMLLLSMMACKNKSQESAPQLIPDPEDTYAGLLSADTVHELMPGFSLDSMLNKYALVRLESDVSHLSPQEKQILKLLFEAADIMDEIFWKQAFGDKESFLARIKDEKLRKYAMINYGPWDRLNDNQPFITGYGPKPAGANFYPPSMDSAEFASWQNPDKSSLYTLVRRDSLGQLKTLWYHEAYASRINKAASLLKEAAALAADAGLKSYLEKRAEALLTDNYQPSDFAWMDMKTANIDVVIGPIENYEDGLYGSKAAQETFILVKDIAWSEKLSHFVQFLPKLQSELPVDPKYKTEDPGTASDLNAYDVVYYAGDCNAGSKTIAINLPNDEQVQLEKGARRLQLKNSMKAKFEKILVPISDVLIAPDQRKHVTFDAFFENVMFHEVAHGLGIKTTINGKGTVRESLGNVYSSMEEGKADILGLFMVTKLHEMGELGEKDLMDNYVTFMAGIFRSVRFGAGSAHGKANMVRFNYFEKAGAFKRNADGTYSVDFKKMQKAMNSLAAEILIIQGNGDMAAARKMIETQGIIKPQLKADLERLNAAGIPVDIIFEQGAANLKLND